MLVLLASWGAIRATESARFVWLAITLAVLAVFSFGSGILAWPIGLGILFGRLAAMEVEDVVRGRRPVVHRVAIDGRATGEAGRGEEEIQCLRVHG